MGAFFQGVKGWSHLSSSKNDCSYLQLYVLLGRFRDRRVSDTFVGVSHVNYGTDGSDRVTAVTEGKREQSRDRRTQDKGHSREECPLSWREGGEEVDLGEMVEGGMGSPVAEIAGPKHVRARLTRLC